MTDSPEDIAYRAGYADERAGKPRASTTTAYEDGYNTGADHKPDIRPVSAEKFEAAVLFLMGYRHEKSWLLTSLQERELAEKLPHDPNQYGYLTRAEATEVLSRMWKAKED